MTGDLFEEHKAIVAAGEEFLAALKRTPRIPMDELSRFRVKLGLLIRQHRATEEELIFGPLMREGGLCQLPQLEPHVQDVMREKSQYSEHVRKWTPQAILHDWEKYVVAVEALLATVKRTIETEESNIYPVLQRLSPSSPQGNARQRA